jgi:lambda family phage portal protein
MIGEAIDKAIATVFPGWGMRRAHARRVYQSMSKRAYEAARIDRTTSAWVANSQSADRALYGEADRVRNRVRDLVRNNAYARGAVDALVANVVGCGITPKPAIEDEPERNKKILDKWNSWCETADVTGRLHFCEMQALAFRETIETGDALLNKVMLAPDPLGGVPMALELIECERIATETDNGFYARRDGATGNQIRRGIEVDRTGRAVAYWLYPTNPNDLGYGFTEAERVDADRILHLFKQERIGQTRGVSWLAPAVLRLRDLDMYLENELQASAVAACFAVNIKTLDGGASWGGLNTPDGQESTDGNYDRLERLQPGQITHTMPGEDIDVINPLRPNAAADAFLATMLRSISVATGLSYELVSRDYSRCNYSSSRASSLEDQRRFRPMQKFLIWRLCQPVYRAWFRQACLAGDSGQPGYDMFPSITEYVTDPDHWLKCNWRAPGWDWVDPLKEVQAAALEVKEGFRSRGDIVERGGDDLVEVFTELSEENDLAETLGLQLGDGQASVNAAKATQLTESVKEANEEVANA